MKKLTPAQQQYADMKKQHPDCVLLFRLGDFYEVFHEDAQIAHTVLGITLTARDKSAENPIPMAGIPYHALEKYLPKLLHAGYKVALAEQIGEVVPGKLVERKITQIYTPGTWIEQGSETKYIVAIAQYADHRAVAWGDSSLGEWTSATFMSRDELLTHIYSLAPRELICSSTVKEIGFFEQWIQQQFLGCLSHAPSMGNAQDRLMNVLGVVTLSGYGQAVDAGVIEAVYALFSYLYTLQQPLLVRRLDAWREKNTFFLDHLTIKNLEIFEGSYNGTKKHTLFGVLNTCKTSMGSRLLASRLTNPTQDTETLHKSHQAIAQRATKSNECTSIREVLKGFTDIPRIAQIITQKKRFIHHVYTLTNQICTAHESTLFVSVLQDTNTELFEEIASFFTTVQGLFRETLIDENDWYKEGIDEEVDRLRHITTHTDTLLLDYQQSLTETYGVPVKVKHVSNQGYLLEVTPKDIQKFEEKVLHGDSTLVRAQTLKTGQRYSSTYLLELQQTIYSAQDDLLLYQKQRAEQLRELRQTKIQLVYQYADAIACLDLYTTMALYIVHHDRIIPQMHTGSDLSIIAGRHPVVEAFLPVQEQFIPNNLHCTQDAFFHVITGPNMGGKSTYMRQNALIVLLAHGGLPVPAKEASVSIVDGIFARIGTGDIIAKQQSTFMTEMIETAMILNNATNRSFIIIDELGRGTSTSDGLALAKAISVYICQQIGAKTLFATHFHELIHLEGILPGVQNWHGEVFETDHEIVFLKKIVRGGTNKSFGLDVAHLAGIPREIVALARQYAIDYSDAQSQQCEHNPIIQQSLFPEPSKGDRILEDLISSYGSIDVSTITPLDAMMLLDKIVTSIRDSENM